MNQNERMQELASHDAQHIIDLRERVRVLERERDEALADSAAWTEWAGKMRDAAPAEWVARECAYKLSLPHSGVALAERVKLLEAGLRAISMTVGIERRRHLTSCVRYGGRVFDEHTSSCTEECAAARPALDALEGR